MLAASGEAAYVHEPFNPSRTPGWFRKPLPYWFLHVTRENEGPYLDDVRRMVELRYPVGSIARSRSPRVLAMNAQQARDARRDKRRERRLLLKDPLAVFSAEWLAERFDMFVVALVRHPASFVSSIKRLSWGFDYERNWLAQALLMKNLLPGYEDRFRGYRGEEDLVSEGIVVWNAIYDVVSKYRERHPGWAVLRYEDVAADPKPMFRKLYTDFGLTWSDEVERVVASHSGEGNPREVGLDRRHEIKRDSKAAARTWKTRLSSDEIERIRRETEPVWRRFYEDSDWD